MRALYLFVTGAMLFGVTACQNDKSSCSSPVFNINGVGTWDGVIEHQTAMNLSGPIDSADKASPTCKLMVQIRLKAQNNDPELTAEKMGKWLTSKAVSNYVGIYSYLTDVTPDGGYILGLAKANIALPSIKNLDAGLPVGWEVHVGTDRDAEHMCYAYVDLVYPIAIKLNTGGNPRVVDVEAWLDYTFNKSAGTSKSGAFNPPPDYNAGKDCLVENSIPDGSARGIIGLK